MMKKSSKEKMHVLPQIVCPSTAQQMLNYLSFVFLIFVSTIET